MSTSMPMPDSTKKKVGRATIFISYSRSDSKAAIRIADALKEADLEVWLDTANLGPGENWVKAIDQALTDAGYLLALLSKASLQSQWVQQEWTAVLTRQLASANGGVVIPLRLEPVDPPTILRPIQSIDLFPDFDKGLKRLIGFLLSETKPAWLVQRRFPATKQVEDFALDSSFRRALETSAPVSGTLYSPHTWDAWHKALQHEAVTDPALKQLDNRTIRRIALRCLTQAELNAFCFDKGISPGSLAGASLNERILSLLHQLVRDGILEDFIKWLAEESPRCVEAAVKVFLPVPPT